VTCINNHLNLSLESVPEGGPFIFWLQGALAGHEFLDERQTSIVRERLNGVFIHVIDPSYSDDPEVQQKLQDIHDGVDVAELQERLEKLEKQKPKRGPRGPAGPRGGGGGTRMMC
jgi:hypothetical protein